MPVINLKSIYKLLLSNYKIVGLSFLVLLVGITILNDQTRNESKLAAVTSPTDKAIIEAQNRVRQYSKTVRYKVNLCNLYLQKSRETADTSYYDKCDELLKVAIKLEPSNGDVVAAKSSIAYGRHDFISGLDLANQAVTLNPNRPSYYGLVGDGQIELGLYAEAAASFQTMINKRPELSSFNRVAYIREIYGDTDGAKRALQSAISAGSSFTENIAYSQVELAKLTGRSDLNVAKKLYEQALTTKADYPPALEGLGKIAFARADYSKAIKYFDQAFTNLPIAQYATDLGDAHQRQGDTTKSAQFYFLANAAFDKSSNSGVNNDYERAVFLTDHDKELANAKMLLEKSLLVRPNMYTYDALAWNAYKRKDYDQAQKYSNQALGSGLKQPVIVFHAGMIAAKLGQTEAAKQYLEKAFALDRHFLEAHFSLLDIKLAKDTLQGL